MILTMTPITSTFILIFLIPEYHTIRIINYDDDINELNTDKTLVRLPSENCGGDESVSFENLNLTNIPATAIKSRTIKNINLQNNFLNRIPMDLFANVPLMECLNVASNQIPFDEIFNFAHSNLSTFIVDAQTDIDNFNWLQVTRWDYPKAHFPKLETLHVNGISTFVLDMFPKNIFPRLTKLYLTSNGFRHIDYDFLSSLPNNLQHLHLEDNDIHKFSVHNLGNLLSLHLDRNPLESIYINSNDTSLETLSLKECSMNNRILEYFSDITLNYLTILDLSQNHLEYLPDKVFDRVKNLQILYLSGNSISELPNISKLHQLRKLSLSYNKIKIVTSLVSDKLTTLNLQCNEIRKITNESFKNLPSLEELDLSNNKLEYLDFDWAHGLHNLNQLNLRFNMFAKITDMSLTHVVSLEKLYIKGNLMKEIDENDLQLIPRTCTAYVM